MAVRNTIITAAPSILIVLILTLALAPSSVYASDVNYDSPVIETINITDELSSGEVAKQITRGDILTLMFGGEQHKTILSLLSTEYAHFVIRSTPSSARLYPGNMTEIDFDEDGTNDMSLSLDSILNSTAYVKLNLLGAETQQPVQQPTPEPQPAPEPEEETNLYLIIGIIGVVILIIIISVFLLKRKKPFKVKTPMETPSFETPKIKESPPVPEIPLEKQRTTDIVNLPVMVGETVTIEGKFKELKRFESGNVVYEVSDITGVITAITPDKNIIHNQSYRATGEVVREEGILYLRISKIEQVF